MLISLGMLSHSQINHIIISERDSACIILDIPDIGHEFLFIQIHLLCNNYYICIQIINLLTQVSKFSKVDK